ncbi:hypothetical protein RZS08_58225, partial [Arthrospira platensis SPKY1]|nr:hypothetical protein [Arthrospira platensis SPKY1]
PSGFEITNDAVFVTDVNDNIGATVYENQIILQRGYWNVDTEDIEYEMDLIDHVTDAELGAPTDVKIAFAADGLTGYMSALSDDGSAEAISGFKGLYPVVFKTTDGGLSWED